ncbi:Head fiber protein [compost metagenome]
MTLEEMRKVGYFYALPEILAMIESDGYTLPAATTAVIGGVKQAVAVPNQGALTVDGADATAVAASATTAVQALTTKINALLAALRTAGVVTP